MVRQRENQAALNGRGLGGDRGIVGGVGFKELAKGVLAHRQSQPLVELTLDCQVGSFAANICDVGHEIIGQFVLNAEAPLLSVGPDGFIGNGSDRQGEGHRRTAGISHASVTSGLAATCAGDIRLAGREDERRAAFEAFGVGFIAVAVVEENAVAAANHDLGWATAAANAPGKSQALQAEFRDKVTHWFAKYDMKAVGYWAPVDAPASDNTFIYILAHPSREEAKKHWDEFRNDPEWKKVSADSEKDGKIVSKVESVFMTPAEFSMLK